PTGLRGRQDRFERSQPHKPGQRIRNCLAPLKHDTFVFGGRMIQLKVNGRERQFDGDVETPLLWYLRDSIDLTGTKFGCGMGLCGACTVHIDGKATRSCLTPMKAAAGKNVLTIEGLSAKGDHPLQKAWKDLNVPQCGY